MRNLTYFVLPLLLCWTATSVAQKESKPTKPKDEDYIWKYFAETCAGIQIVDSINGSTPRTNFHVEIGSIPKRKEWAVNIVYDNKDRYVFRFPMDQTDSLTLVPKNQFTDEISVFVLRFIKDENYYVVYLVDADRDIFSRTGRIPREWVFEPEFFDSVEFTLTINGEALPLVLEE